MKKIPVRIIQSRGQQTAARFNIRHVDEILDGHDLAHALHRHSFFFVLLLTAGEGLHEIDFAPFDIKGKCIFLLRPGQVHQLHLKAGATGYLLEFDGNFYHPAEKGSTDRFRKAVSKNFYALEEKGLQRLERILGYMYDEYSAKEDAYVESIKANLELFFIELVRQIRAASAVATVVSPYVQERFEEFLECLDKNMSSHKQVSQYAGMMNLSSYQLNEIVKAAVGKSPSEQINEQIVLEAKRYLLATTSQVKDIAGMLGYEDASYFVRFFKKHTGLTPEAFRSKPA